MKEKVSAIKNGLDPFYNSFLEYLPFDNSRLFFHKRAIELASPNLSTRHLRYVYECIIQYIKSQYINSNIQIEDFSIFYQSVQKEKNLIQRISNKKIDSFDDWYLLESLFSNIKITINETYLVIQARILSQILPNLCPPIDISHGKHFFLKKTFEEKDIYNQVKEYTKLITEFYAPLAKEKLVQHFFNKYKKTTTWNTSYPRFLNHLVIGCVIYNKKDPEEHRPLIEAVI
ncbi:MAG: hypothetical protein ACEPOW_06265 [Bacteroidales bacterium]